LTFSFSMLNGVTMLKEHAIALFGSCTELAKALGYSKSFISQLPDTLPQKYADQVTGAAIRNKKSAAAVKRLRQGKHPFPSSVSGASQCA